MISKEHIFVLGFFSLEHQKDKLLTPTKWICVTLVIKWLRKWITWNIWGRRKIRTEFSWEISRTETTWKS